MVKVKHENKPEHFDDVFRAMIATQVLNDCLTDIQGHAIWKHRLKKEITRTERELNLVLDPLLKHSGKEEQEQFAQITNQVHDFISKVMPQINVEK